MAKENRSAANESGNLFDAKAQAAMEKKKEIKKGILTGICVVLAVAAMGVIVYKNVVDSGYLLRREIAAESENFEVNGNMMKYYLSNTYQQYSSYAESLGIDTKRPLKEQESSMGGGTWFDYFMNLTESTVEQVLSLCESAKAAGVELDEDDTASIDDSIEQLKMFSSMYGFASFDQFLTMNYGGGIKEKDIRAAMELEALANKYSVEFSESLSYTTEECEEYYKNNTDDFDSVDLLTYTVPVSDFEAMDETGEVINAEEAREKAEEQARTIAGAESAEEFKARVKDYLVNVKGEEEDHAEEHMAELLLENVHKTDSLDPAVITWVFDEDAQAGSRNVFTADDTSYDAYYLVETAGRDETIVRNVRHILFDASAYETEEEGQAAVEAAYAEWEEAGFSDEKFAELNTLYNTDTGSVNNGGLYENVAPGAMVAEFNDWLFDSARVAGDHGIVKTSYGWHIMSYVGEGEKPAWQIAAENALSSEDYTEMLEAGSASVVFHPEAIAHIDA